MKNSIFDEAIGWYGACAIIAAYAANSFGFLGSGSLAYQILNGTGALGIVYISFKKKTLQPGVLNIVWAAIAVAAIIRILA
jgi:hypothetical protein